MHTNPRPRKSALYYFSNVLIIASLLGFMITVYPILSLFLFPPHLEKSVHEKGYFITIPKIHAQSPIVDNVDPFNEKVYKEALHHGVARSKNSVEPGQNGTVFIFAHSSGPPWELARYNTVFLRLGDLQKNDLIIVSRDGKEYQYHVREKKEVSPTEVNYLLSTKTHQLVLQTCTPIGTDFKRLLVFATPV